MQVVVSCISLPLLALQSVAALSVVKDSCKTVWLPHCGTLICRWGCLLCNALSSEAFTALQVAVLLYLKTGGQVDRYFTSR